MSNKREPSSLMPEIIFNILTRLPVKPLCRFKAVNSDWKAMISSREFVKEHLRRANDMHRFGFHKFMYLKHRFSIQHISSKSFDLNSLNQVALTLPFSNEYVNAEVVASCDGLLLLYKGNMTYVLWNPSTRAHLEISGLHHNRSISSGYRLYGIIYDASFDAYKIIVVARINYSQEDTLTTIYNCRTCLCTYTTRFPYWIPRNEQGATVNGVPHWLVSHREKAGCAIIYYDLAKETFREVPKPEWAENVCELGLKAHKGMLCLVHYNRGYADIWIMKTYGEKESWTKLYPYVLCSGEFNIRPLGLTREDRVVMEVDQSKVNIYDPSTRNFSSKNIYTYPNNGFNAATYVESLVTPSGHGVGLLFSVVMTVAKGFRSFVWCCYDGCKRFYSHGDVGVGFLFSVVMTVAKGFRSMQTYIADFL